MRIAATTDIPKQRFLSLTSAQQPSIRQPFGQHHEPCQPEALLLQAEADQQAVSLECDAASRQAKGSHVNIETNIQQERQRLYSARPFRAHTLSQQREERRRSKISRPQETKKDRPRSWICGNCECRQSPSRNAASEQAQVVTMNSSAWLARTCCGEKTRFAKRV